MLRCKLAEGWARSATDRPRKFAGGRGAWVRVLAHGSFGSLGGGNRCAARALLQTHSA